MNDEFFLKIKEACRGLVYISETDSTVEAITFRDRDELFEAVSRDAQEDFPGARESREFDEFFSRLTAKKDWHTEEKTKQVEAFTRLRDLFSQSTDHREVIRQGDVRIRIYVFGEREGRIYGVAMTAVET